jgi:hypothetical protein
MAASGAERFDAHAEWRFSHQLEAERSDNKN